MSELATPKIHALIKFAKSGLVQLAAALITFGFSMALVSWVFSLFIRESWEFPINSAAIAVFGPVTFATGIDSSVWLVVPVVVAFALLRYIDVFGIEQGLARVLRTVLTAVSFTTALGYVITRAVIDLSQLPDLSFLILRADLAVLPTLGVVLLLDYRSRRGVGAFKANRETIDRWTQPHDVMNNSWRNTAIFSFAYLVISFVLTTMSVLLALSIYPNLPNFGIGDFLWKYAMDVLTPFTNILMVVISPNAWWLGLAVLSFFLPVAADGNAWGRKQGEEQRAIRSETLLAITGIALNTATVLLIVLTSIRPDLPFNEQFAPIASAASSAVAAALAFAVWLIATRRRKTDKL